MEITYKLVIDGEVVHWSSERYALVDDNELTPFQEDDQHNPIERCPQCGYKDPAEGGTCPNCGYKFCR